MSTATATRRRVPMPTLSPCGVDLWGCRCEAGMAPRTAAEIAALHVAAVQRAYRAGWDTPELRLWVLSVVGR